MITLGTARVDAPVFVYLGRRLTQVGTFVLDVPLTLDRKRKAVPAPTLAELQLDSRGQE